MIRRILLRAVRSARFLPDRWAIALLYRLTVGRWPNIRAPATFTEKLQWLKLHDRNPLYKIWVDKCAVRAWIADKVGPDALIPVLAFFDEPLEMADTIYDIASQPMILKCSHGSHCGIFLPSQVGAGMEKIAWRMQRWMWRSWYWYGREWPYRGLTPMILCEKWLGDRDGNPPNDYKVMCFNGRARVLQLHRKRGGVHHIDFYDMCGYKLPFGLEGYPNDGYSHVTVPLLWRMREIAENVAEGTRYLRVDMYMVSGRVYAGELTLYDSSGFGRYTGNGDAYLGGLLQQMEVGS